MTLATLALLALVPTAPALSVDLDKAIVPADSPFLVHVDLAAFKRTRLAGALIERLQGELDLEGMQFDDIEAEFGIHPLKDLHSVTVFSANGEADGGVAVVRTSARLDGLLERLAREEGYRTFEQGGLTLHGLDDDALAYVHAVDAERLVVISDDVEQVLGAARVLRGERPSLARARQPGLRARPLGGAFLYVEVGSALAELIDDSPASQVGRLAKRVMIQVGESEARTFLRAEVEATDGRAAENIANVLNGVISLARLAGGDELPAFALDLLDDLDVTLEGSSVRLDLDFDGLALLEALEALDDF